MLDSIVSWLGYFPHHYWHAGEEPARVGMRHHYVTPYGPHPAGDGEYVNLAVASASDWEVFCRKVIERPELLEDPRFGYRRGAAGKTAANWKRPSREFLGRKIIIIGLGQLKTAELPYGEVRGIAQVLAHPQVIARKLTGSRLAGGEGLAIANALKMSGSEARYDRIPALGADSEAILKELGYDTEAIAQLRRDQVI